MSSIPIRLFDIAPDGRHFYAIQWSEPPSQPRFTHIQLVQNWFWS